jgi:hypothetical protein
MKTVCRQRIGKHVPAATNTTIESLLETVFSIPSMQSGYNEDNLGRPGWLSVVGWQRVENQPVKRRLGGWCEMAASLGVSCQLRVEFCTGGCEDRTWARVAEESPLLEAIARKRLMTQQAAGRLSGCCGDLWSVEISDNAVVTVVPSGVYQWSVNPFTNPHPVYNHP